VSSIEPVKEKVDLVDQQRLAHLPGFDCDKQSLSSRIGASTHRVVGAYFFYFTRVDTYEAYMLILGLIEGQFCFYLFQ
jgi:hypothetical protein